jgi:hypothetical protein
MFLIMTIQELVIIQILHIQTFLLVLMQTCHMEINHTKIIMTQLIMMFPI